MRLRLKKYLMTGLGLSVGLIFLVGIVGFVLPSIISKYKQESGAIGDVKYSILAPEDFEDVNGCGWQLLDGTRLNESSDLFEYLQTKGLDREVLKGEEANKLPDARGLFIRGMNVGRPDGNGDVNNRKVGSFQDDAFEKHDHGGIYGGTSKKAGMLNEYAYHSSGYEKIKPEGGSETRPRNISLYIYIKVKRNCE